MSRNIDISKFKKDVRENAAKKNGKHTVFAIPNGVELISIGDPKKGEDMVKRNFDFVLYKQTKDKNTSGYDYKRSYKVHNGLGEDGNQTVLCPSTFGKPCPICEMRKKLSADWDSLSDAQKAELKKLKAKSRSLYPVIEGGKFKLFDCSDALFQDKLNEEINAAEDESIYSFANDEGGMTLKTRWKKENKGKGINFYECTNISFIDREDLTDDEIDSIIKIDDLFEEKSYEELQNILNGTEPDDEEEEIEEHPVKVSSKRHDDEDDDEDETPSKKAKVVDDDDEDEAPWGDDDDDEPVRKPHRRVVEDDDDED